MNWVKRARIAKFSNPFCYESFGARIVSSLNDVATEREWRRMNDTIKLSRGHFEETKNISFNLIFYRSVMFLFFAPERE